MTPYRSAPSSTEQGWPKGISYIVGNEGCERFSYYGMSAILYVYIIALQGSGDYATSVVHLFISGVYAFPLIGAVIADRLLGKYHTILWFSLVYCLGHLVLSLTEGSMSGLYFGLSLIALGAGGIKPCVSAHVGDQFGKSNWRLIPKVYQVFYFIINFGSFFATLLIPVIRSYFGWSVAFAIPGVLMFVATGVFWMGRNKFVHVPPQPGGHLGLLDATSSIFLFASVGSLAFTASLSTPIAIAVSMACLMIGLVLFQVRQSKVRDDGFLAVSLAAISDWFRRLFLRISQWGLLFSATSSSGGSQGHGAPKPRSTLRDQFSTEAIDGASAIVRILSIFLFVSIFWALFDQHGSSWIRQAKMMNLNVLGFELMPSQIQGINPILVMILIPLMSYMFGHIKPLLRMSVGMIIASFSFVVVALIQAQLDQGAQLNVVWQLLPYILITVAEVLVSVTGLEFAYTQAPKRMKSTVMGFWLLSVAFGNILVAFTARFAGLPLVDFFWVFAGLMAIAAGLFALRARYYVPQDYPQH
ncbi:MAG: MFS transporter [Deltaproteobacteria bacterium]|nr:MFS transporter [Deltaproteobacteria bacterium]